MTSASGDLASDEQSASDDVSFFWTSCLQNFYSSELQASSLFIPLFSFVLPEPMLKQNIEFFCLWSCTLEQILAYPIDNF